MPAPRDSPTVPARTDASYCSGSNVNLTILESPAARQYRCPGESQPISQAVHLARLLGHYTPCAGCPWRHDTGTLVGRRVAELGRLKPPDDSIFATEDVQADYLNQLAPGAATRLALAFGVHLLARQPAPGSVLIGSDAGELTPELIARAAEGIRLAGHDVCDVGRTSAPRLAHAQQSLSGVGAILISQAARPRHRIGIRFWARGVPLSKPGSLAAIEDIFRAGPIRPTRKSGALSRASLDDAYLAHLAVYFHALRPLRFVLECDSRSLLGDLKGLLKNVACELIPAASVAVDRQSAPRSARAPNVDASSSPAARLGAKVKHAGAHLGAVVFAQGECLHVCDELGSAVAPDRLLAVLRQELALREPESSHDVVAPVAATTEAAARAALDLPASIAGGPDGRCLFRAGDVVSADALEALALLLAALSRSDRPLSRVVDCGLAP